MSSAPAPAADVVADGNSADAAEVAGTVDGN